MFIRFEGSLFSSASAVFAAAMWNFVLLLLLTASRISCQGKSNRVAEPPRQFSDSYSTKGTLYIPYAEIREPFYAWFDLKNASSRIDYYGGMVKTFQLGKDGMYGKAYKVAPVTTEEVQNVETCLTVPGIMSVQPQSVLPDISHFEFAGNDMINGIPCYKWSLINNYGDKVNRYTMWTRSKKAWRKGGEDMAIPVRYEMKGYNTLLGSHYDHYYLDYEWFSPETPTPDVFAISNYTCEDFPGPGIDHIYTFNPMKEFVHNYDKHVHFAFEDFKKTHRKAYDTDKEHLKRFDLFRQNLRYIHSHNRAGLPFTLGVNHLADRDDLELRALRGNRPAPAENHALPFHFSKEQVRHMKKDLPKSLDWRINGAVTPVKDQSVCGSCWSFGTTGTIEGAYFLKYGKLLRFSQQALIDCSWGFGNNGCDGGEDFRSYNWMMMHGGLPTEDDYGPYLGQDGYCHVNQSMERAQISSFHKVTPGDQDALKVAVATYGPISVAIDASHKTFSFYSHGVYYDPQCGNGPMSLDHAVVLVGYGTLGDEEYWLVKNSWSTYWGNDGYVLMSLKGNNCGVATDATYVVMK